MLKYYIYQTNYRVKK